MVADGRHKPPDSPPKGEQPESPETDNIVAEEKQKKSIRIAKLWKQTSLFLLIVIIIIVSVDAMLRSNGYVREALLNRQINELNVQLEDVDDQLYNRNGELLAKSLELEELKNLDLKCIPKYIKSRFSKTPTILAEAIAEAIVRLSKEFEVPIPLIVGIVETESHFNPYVVSSAGARGLMQVMPTVWSDELGIPSPDVLHEIEDGIRYGIMVLKVYLVKANNNLGDALWQYNGRASDKKKYTTKVFEDVGRYILHKCRTSFPAEEMD